MAAIQQDIDIYINKAQTKIAALGDDMLVSDSNGLDIRSSVMLIQELYASVRLLQNRPDSFTDGEVYELISNYNYKAKLTNLPLSIFDTNVFSDNVLLSSGGYLTGPTGPQGVQGTQGIQGDDGADGADGADGNDGWTAITANVPDGDRIVQQVTGWTGGTGTPPASGVYVGPSGYVSLIADATDIRGAQGDTGDTGDTGADGPAGDSAYTYIAYASDTSGTGFTTVFSGTLEYIAIKSTTSPIVSPSASDFAGLWYRWKGIQGDPFSVDAQGLISDRGTYDTQSTGFTYLATDTGNIYIKNSNVTGDWSLPISFVGDKGWSPTLAVVEDGERRVMKLTGWIGGEGSEPAEVDLYMSDTGYVSDIASATDFRGPVGNFIINAQGDLADRTTYDNEEVPFVYYATDNGLIYFKASDTSGDWTAGFPFRGDPGVQGPTGSTGANAYTQTNGSFTQPAVNATVSVNVDSTDWMAVGQIVFIETAGYYEVSSIASGFIVVLENLGYEGNAVPTTVIADDSKISPAGIAGLDVSDAAYNATTWNGVTTIAPSKNAVRDEFENKVSKLTGSVLFDFSNTETLNITTDNGGFTRSHIHLADEEMNFGWGDYLIVFTGAYSKFVSPSGDVFVPEGNGDTLALISDVSTALSSAEAYADSLVVGLVSNARTLTINGTALDLSADRSWSVGDALVVNPLSQFAATTSLQLKGVISDETGSGSLVFADTPTLITPILGTPTSGTLTNCTGLPMTTGVTGILAGTNGGTGINNGSNTLTLGGNTSITGGGTLGLGGFTLTVPATGTAALLGTANVFTADQSHTGNIIPTATNTYDFGANTSTGDWRKLYGRTLGVADASGTNIAGTALNLLAGAGTGTGTETYIGLQTAIKGSSGSTVQSLANTMTVSLLSGSSTYTGIWLRTAPGSRTNSNYILASDAAGTVLSGSNDVSLAISGGSKLTITSSAATFADAVNLAFNTSTGSKIGTATSQKIGFWNATPIIQPTTGVAASTLVSNGGTTLTDTDTFDGYTLKQIVKAIRNIGLLA